MSDRLVEHFFRHEYGRLVARLTRRVGAQHLAIVEDAVQSALMAAIERWRGAPPDDPSAWLFTVAFRRVLQDLRGDTSHAKLLQQHGEVLASVGQVPAAVLAGEVGDDLLRMLFVCADEVVPADSQLALALKTLCGFDVREIAVRLFTTEANVYKRLARARAQLRASPPALDRLDPETLTARQPRVHRMLYLLFTEGYLSSHARQALRRELCDEALRLAHVLAAHPVGRDPTTFALVALMHLHRARLPARQDGAGGLLLLVEQDRTAWDREEIAEGLRWLGRSAQGDVFSRYHAEAGIAAEHGLAPSFAETRWDRVADLYALLERAAPSPVHKLNRAVAVAEGHGPEAGLAVLEGFEPPAWLVGSYLWGAVLADLHRRAGHADEAVRYRRLALETAPTDAIREVLTRRLAEDARRLSEGE